MSVARDNRRLQDRIDRGMGIAARRLGAACELFRPSGPNDPLGRGNRRLRLHAAFNAQDGTFRRPASYGHAVRWGVFDAAYTRPGDYLAGEAGVFFISAQQPLLPILCVQTNRTVTLRRPARAMQAGAGGYGGVQPAMAAVLAAGWPANLLGIAGGGRGDLPGDGGPGSVTVLLPPMPVVPRTSDLISDDLGREFVIAGVEQTSLGWRMDARQSAS